jgi:hypothetical protein
VRTSGAELSALIHGDNPRSVPHGPASKYYAAQMLHYGLVPTRKVKIAITTFKAAFAGQQGDSGADKKYLRVPLSIVKIRKSLRAEYKKQIKNDKAQAQAQQERITAIQKQLAEIAAIKQKEEDLRSELQLLTCPPRRRSSVSPSSTAGDNALSGTQCVTSEAHNGDSPMLATKKRKTRRVEEVEEVIVSKKRQKKKKGEVRHTEKEEENLPLKNVGSCNPRNNCQGKTTHCQRLYTDCQEHTSYDREEIVPALLWPVEAVPKQWRIFQARRLPYGHWEAI